MTFPVAEVGAWVQGKCPDCDEVHAVPPSIQELFGEIDERPQDHIVRF